MTLSRLVLATLSPVAAAWPLLAAESTKLALKAPEGRELEFTVQRRSTMEGSSSRGESRTQGTSTVTYRIAARAAEGGGLVLKVRYGSLKAQQEGGRGSWELDSTALPGADDPVATYVKDVLSRPITVTFAGEKIGEISGFPEIERPRQGERGSWRRWQGRQLAGPEALRRDLELIVSAAVLGQDLEKGKSYRAAPEPAGDEGTDAEGRRRRRRFGFAPLPLTYRFDGREEKGAKFTLAAAEQPGGEGPRPQVHAKGTALVSLEDGLALRVELEASEKGERQLGDQSFTFSRAWTIEVTRGGAAKKAVSL